MRLSGRRRVPARTIRMLKAAIQPFQKTDRPSCRQQYLRGGVGANSRERNIQAYKKRLIFFVGVFSNGWG